MPGIADLHAAHLARLLDPDAGHAEDIIRYPLGDGTNPIDVFGVFQEEPATPDESRGRETVRRGWLLVADTVDVDAQDRWLIDDEVWQTKGPGKTSDGARELLLQRNDRELGKGGAGKLI